MHTNGSREIIQPFPDIHERAYQAAIYDTSSVTYRLRICKCGRTDSENVRAPAPCDLSNAAQSVITHQALTTHHTTHQHLISPSQLTTNQYLTDGTQGGRSLSLGSERPAQSSS
ncbi:hypothetical protein Pcinc_034471 [Petrolisthes cinctipes]|uniref:Uncharacterized protein n=1 Tax=Petrolisthes cinctipes TaxID=88211 RepID=A0AAE1EQ61_PETCI|nr:hypothetical protein Pcinc_034471 [Petrolisthes cinctipes]